jgi:hypothetical protein
MVALGFLKVPPQHSAPALKPSAMALVLPHSPACLVCGVPFTGVSGRLAGVVGLGRNPANPELCNRCNSHFVAGDIQSASALALKLPGELTLGGAPLEASRSSQEGLIARLERCLQGMGAHVVRQRPDADGLGLIAFFNVPVPVPDPPRKAVAAAREVLELVATEEQISRVRHPLRAGVAAGFVETVRVGPEDLQLIGQVSDTASRLASLSPPGEISLDAPSLSAAGLASEGGPLRWDRAYGFDNTRSFERPGALGGDRRPPAAALALLLALVAAPCAAMLSLGPAAVAIGAGALFTALVPALKTIGMNTGLRLALAGLALALATGNLIAAERRLRRQRPLVPGLRGGRPLRFSQRSTRDIRLVRLLTLLVYGAVFGELLLRVTVMKMPPL